MSDIKNPTSPAFKAFVDASAGAMGALFAAVLLYPLDVVKTRRQVEVSEKPAEGEDEEAKSKALAARKKKARNLLVTVWLIYRHEGLQGLFAGLSSKMAHTVTSNFAYFYWYSFLKTAVEKRATKPITTGMSLLMASTAGALNMSMTLPLEMINTRAQIQSNEDKSADAGGAKTETASRSMWDFAKEIYAEDGLASFWKGFLPSLVLVSNPSINYTVFDKLKLKLQQTRMTASGASRVSSLTALEAFVLAAIAKAVATIITYPMIRAKVLMQAQKKQLAAKESGADAAPAKPQTEMGTSMVQVLKRIGELEGLSGYFKGCSAQLFNTVLKSALLVMTKEEITKYTMRVLFLLRRNASPKAAIEAAKV